MTIVGKPSRTLTAFLPVKHSFGTLRPEHGVQNGAKRTA
jgi:hypothetical protein